MSNIITLPETKISIAARPAPETRGRPLSAVMEKILLIEPGQVAEIRGTINMRSIYARVSGKKNQAKLGKKFTVRKVAGGCDIYRTA